MKIKKLHLIFILLIFFTSCSQKNSDVSPSSTYLADGISSPTGSFATSDGKSSSSSPSPSKESSSPPSQTKPGLITAGEWNDLENWSFWNTLLEKQDYSSMQSNWSFFNTKRVSVKLVGEDSKPVIDASVKLKRNGIIIYSARSDNKGQVELWVDLFENSKTTDYAQLVLDVNNGSKIVSTVKSFKEGVNTIVVPNSKVDNKIELSFVVDATGSMGDELEYLKTELNDVISKVKTANPQVSLSTSSVFYRDQGDEYLTRVSNFTNTNATTINFIKNQSAGGGGDFPEAVHSALEKAVNELQWSTSAKARLLFLVLDAPPHENSSIMSSIQKTIIKASEKGIKVIPITASGIDKKTEFLMRFMSISTNGTYVFITDHSGIGNSHLEPSIGKYEVEFLNDLMVRLINKYVK
ncbi:MAG: vWA domain-containing protein [Leadbetterella sp.]